MICSLNTYQPSISKNSPHSILNTEEEFSKKLIPLITIILRFIFTVFLKRTVNIAKLHSSKNYHVGFLPVKMFPFLSEI